MMRPLLIANYDFVLGGGEVGLRQLVAALIARGHAPVIAVPGSTPLVGAGEERSIPPSIPGGAAALAGLSADCDLVHAFSIRAALTAILGRTDRPLVFHALVPTPDHYDAIVASFADAILCNSDATARRFSRGLGRVVYNGVPHPRPTAGRLDLRPGRRTIGVVGNLCPRKGQLDALPALDQVLQARDDVDVAFAGHSSGPVAMALTDRAAASNGRIRMLGWVPDIADHFHEFALVLVPSRSEGFGRVAVESLRAGVPVLATRIEGLIEALRDLSDPWLPSAPEGWGARILRELDHPSHSPDELRAAARRFDPDRFAEDVLDCYRDVISRSGRPASRVAARCP